MTKNEILDHLQAVYARIQAHLLTQGQKARNKHDVCMYRDNKGRTCAVGCLIDNYDTSLERYAVLDKPILKRLFQSGVLIRGQKQHNLAMLGLLQVMQRIHDEHDQMWNTLPRDLQSFLTGRWAGYIVAPTSYFRHGNRVISPRQELCQLKEDLCGA